MISKRQLKKLKADAESAGLEVIEIVELKKQTIWQRK